MRKTHQTEPASGGEQTASLRQELRHEVGRKQIEHVGGNEAVETAIRLLYARRTIALVDTCTF